jgi:two-component system chemotaxis response regulator CheB
MDGVEAVRRIMRMHPLPVIALSSYTPRGSALAAAALGAGALEVHAKDEIRLVPAYGVDATTFRRRLKDLSRARVGTGRRPAARLPGSASSRLPALVAPATVIAICASTGGPAALRAVLGKLPADFPLPVLVVQHMTPGFTASFARWLEHDLAPPVALAADGKRARSGVWIAPDGAHLLLERSMRMRLDTTTPGTPHRPAGDALLNSVAASGHKGAIAVVLTGMGRDGAEGTAAVRAAGGMTIAQDEGTSAIYGMPRAAVELGAQIVLPLDEIGDVLISAGARG